MRGPVFPFALLLVACWDDEGGDGHPHSCVCNVLLMSCANAKCSLCDGAMSVCVEEYASTSSMPVTLLSSRAREQGRVYEQQRWQRLRTGRWEHDEVQHLIGCTHADKCHTWVSLHPFLDCDVAPCRVCCLVLLHECPKLLDLPIPKELR